MAPTARSRRLRWLAPLATAALVGLLVAVPGLSAAATPTLPPITAQQLLAKVHDANVESVSGTLNLTTNLGIPDLGALSDAVGGGGGQGVRRGRTFSPTDLLSGSHKALVWFDGPERARIALLRDMAETDVVRNGQDVWTWDSTTKQVVHATLARPTQTHDANGKRVEPVPTPQQAAKDLLAHLSPSTQVTVAAPVRVAGQKAYQLVLAPHSADSTVDHVAIAVDGATGLPLQVQVFARGQKAAALTLGFGSISYSTPAASRFSFSPPPGSTVRTETAGGSHPTPPSQPSHPTTNSSPNADHQETTVGQGWTTVAIFPAGQIPAQLSTYLNQAARVSGAFGQGRLLQTSLVNVLVLQDGRVALGAVTPHALEAAIAAAP